MRDGYTRKLERPLEECQDFSQFVQRWRVAVVVLSGGAAGNELPIEQPGLTFGRGPGVDFAFNDSAMSKEHAVLEFTGGAYRLRDLGSMNGLLVNGRETKLETLENGDRFQLGEHSFQLLLDERKRSPKVYVLPDE